MERRLLASFFRALNVKKNVTVRQRPYVVITGLKAIDSLTEDWCLMMRTDR